MLCKAIQELTQNEQCTGKGLGDSAHEAVFISHINPKEQVQVARLVGRKCSVECLLNEKPVEMLLGYWGTSSHYFRTCNEH